MSDSDTATVGMALFAASGAAVYALETYGPGAGLPAIGGLAVLAAGVVVVSRRTDAIDWGAALPVALLAATLALGRLLDLPALVADASFARSTGAFVALVGVAFLVTRPVARRVSTAGGRLR